jgi:hypothetical protein
MIYYRINKNEDKHIDLFMNKKKNAYYKSRLITNLWEQKLIRIF